MTEQNLQNNQTEKPLIVLIHGLHQRHWIMKPLAYNFEKLGYNTLCFDYYSLTESIEQHSSKLNDWLTNKLKPNQQFNMVSHSLGGLVLRDFVTRYPHWHENGQIANCVTLGTPHMGSTTADYVKKIIPFAVGRAYEGALDGQTASLPDDICLGVIAGSKPNGLGQPVLEYHNYTQEVEEDNKQHDGTVYVHETKLPNAKDHIVMPVTHTGMLMNKDVLKQADYFLKHGKFER